MGRKTIHLCPVCNESKWTRDFPIVRKMKQYGERFVSGHDFSNCSPCKRAIKAAMPKVSKRKRKPRIAEIKGSYGIAPELRRWLTGAHP